MTAADLRAFDFLPAFHPGALKNADAWQIDLLVTGGNNVGIQGNAVAEATGCGPCALVLVLVLVKLLVTLQVPSACDFTAKKKKRQKWHFFKVIPLSAQDR